MFGLVGLSFSGGGHAAGLWNLLEGGFGGGRSRGRGAPVGAVTCTQLSCHSAVTLHILATEQKHCAYFFSKVVGLFQCSAEKLVRLT